jgi:hypothetical protein
VRDFSRIGSRVMGMGVVLFAVALGTMAARVGLAAPQFGTAAPAPQAIESLDHSRVPDDPSYVPRELQARQLKRLREEHQKQVFSDAARLVQLATALKQQVQKGDKVSMDAMKDVDEIGKLAKRVSDRIKTQ